MTDLIKDGYGRKLGTVDTDSSGNVIVRDAYGRIVARYDKGQNATRDFYGRLIAWGNVAAGFLLKGLM